MKKLIAGLLSSSLALAGLAACSGDENNTSAEETGLHVSLIAKGSDDHWALVRSGAIAAGEELGAQVNFNAPDTESEGDRQINMLQSAVNDGPDGIGLAPQDGAQNAAPELLEQADAAGIPVVAFDTEVEESDIPVATIASDNYGMGAQLAEHLSELIDGEGKVAMVVQGVVGTAAQRRDGFVNWMEENAPGIQVVDIQNGEADPAKSRDKAQGILQAHPDLRGLVGTSNYSTIAIADEVAAKGMDVTVVGIDAAPDVITLLEEGKIAGIITQNPWQIGFQTVEVLVAAASGEMPSEPVILTDSVWATAENLTDPAIRKSLGLDE